MDQRYEIGLHVKTSGDDAALRQTEQGLDRVRQQHTTMTEGARKGWASLIENVATYALAIFGLRKAFDFLKNATAEFLANARALRVIKETAEEFGQSGEKAAAATEALARSLRRVGVDDAEVLKAVRDLLLLTRDYEEAVTDAGLAADIAAKKNIPYTDALGLVIDLVAAGPRSAKRAHEMLGTEAKTAQGALDELYARFSGYRDKVDDQTRKINENRAELNELGQTLGGWFATEILPIVTKALHGLVIGLKVLTQAFLEMKERARVWGMELYVILHPKEFGGLKASLDLVAAMEKVAEDLRLRRARAFREEMDSLLTGKPGKAPAGKPPKTHPMAEPEEVVTGGSLDAEKAYKDLLAKQLRALGIYYGKVDALRDADKAAEFAKFRALAEWYARIDALQQQDIADKKNATQTQIQGFATITGAMQGFFAENKGMASALALIHAFLAAAGAMSETHGDIYTRIAAYIAAFAQAYQAVVGIGSTDYSGGASVGAARAAAAPAISVTGGLTPTAPTMPGSTSMTNVTTNAPATTVVNVNALDTTNALRSAQRALRPAGRAYDRTLVGRGSVIVGTRRPR